MLTILDKVLIYTICAMLVGYGIITFQTVKGPKTFVGRLLKTAAITIVLPFGAWKDLIVRIFR